MIKCFVVFFAISLNTSLALAQEESAPLVAVKAQSPSAAPFRIGAGLDAGLSATRAGLSFSPQTVLIAEYCVTQQFCVTGSGRLFFGDFSFVNGERGGDGFDGALSLGGRFIFTPGPSEFSVFANVNAGYQNFGALDRASFGVAGGVAFEQRLWKNIRARLSTPLVSLAGATNFGFGGSLLVSPTGAIILEF